MQDKLLEHNITVQTVAQVCPIHVYPARVLTQIYSLLGIIVILIVFITDLQFTKNPNKNALRRDVLDTTLCDKFVCDLRQICDFIQVLLFPPPIKLTAMI
jgi:hypothetical protein